MNGNLNIIKNYNIVTVGSLLRHLESGWIFCNQFHDLVEFFLIENMKRVSG